jgi:hypothetical protein
MTKKKKRNYGTSGGLEITDEVIQKLADEAEAGYELSQLTPRRGRPPMGSAAATVFQVRLEPELREALAREADVQRTSPSEVVRRILRTYLGVGDDENSASRPSNAEIFRRAATRRGRRPTSQEIVDVIREGREGQR